MRYHRARVRVSERNLRFPSLYQLRFNFLERRYLRFHRCDLVVDTNAFRLWSGWFLPVNGIEFCHIANDIRFNLRYPALEFCIGKIAAAAVDGLEFTAADSDDCIRKKIQLLALHNELPADLADRFAVIFG